MLRNLTTSLVVLAVLAATPAWAQETTAPPADAAAPAADAPAADAPAADAPAADVPAAPATEEGTTDPNAPASQPAQAPADAPATPAQPPHSDSGGENLVPKLDMGRLGIPALGPAPATRGSLTQRLLMDVVSGAAGAAVVVVMGWALALPLALLPWILPQSVSNAAVLGVPVSVLIAGGGVVAVLLSAIVASAALQRVVRPLLGPEPSTLGPVLGALFFGGVGVVVGGVAAFLAITTPPEPLRPMRDRMVGDISGAEGRALAIVGAAVVGVAVPVAALAAAIGGPISAEVEDSRAEEAGGSGGGATGGPVRN